MSFVCVALPQLPFLFWFFSRKLTPRSSDVCSCSAEGGSTGFGLSEVVVGSAASWADSEPLIKQERTTIRTANRRRPGNEQLVHGNSIKFALVPE